MAVAKIQKGDRVKVISGGYKGTVGIVSRVLNKKTPQGGVRTRVSVSEVPQIVDYRRSLKMHNMPGEMRTKDRLLDASSVQLVDDKGQVFRTKVVARDDKKVRVSKKTDTAVQKAELTEVKTDEVKEDKPKKPKTTKAKK